MSQSTLHSPKADHPWRQYKNNRSKNISESDFIIPSIPLKEFLKDIVENWDTYQIPPESFSEREYLYLAKVSPHKQVEWLTSFLRKHWLTQKQEASFIDL